ncbi:hypothetical protein BX600DRAFT_511311 [Xylariales sp. PMI_506]|nr:hypothetical protein BX600DRAFT_511311 [Xylariales sp. PMI_506]
MFERALQRHKPGRVKGCIGVHLLLENDDGLSKRDPALFLSEEDTTIGAGMHFQIWSDLNDDDDLLLLDESSIDALVADSYPLLEVGSPRISGRSASGTPGPPPGLGFPHGHLPVQFGETIPVVPTVTPQSPAVASPIVARPSPAVPRPVTPLTPFISKATMRRDAKSETAPNSDAKRNIKDLAVETGLSKEIAMQSASASPSKTVLQEEDFPALDSSKTRAQRKVTPALPAKPAAPTGAAQSKRSHTETPGKESGAQTPATQSPTKAAKRPAPVLDIAAATKAVAQLKEEELGKTIETNLGSSAQVSKSAAVSTLPTPTTTASVSSPLARAAPKTLRLVQTPKTEVAPILAPSVATSLRAAAVAAAGHRPGTPASEAVSDTASIISASVSASRTSSPPPSKIGSAALRITTKSQQRKQRNKASKEAAAAIIADSKPAEPEEVAPIIGRKKKQKKEKKEKVSRTASPAVSRPETPPADAGRPEMLKLEPSIDKGGPSPEKHKTKVAAKNQTEVDISVKAKDTKSPPESPRAVDTSIRLNESTKTTVLTPDFVNPKQELQQEQVFEGEVGDAPGLSEILQTLIEDGELPDPDDINLFKPVPNYRVEADRFAAASLPPTLPPTVKSVVTKDDESELNAFRPVRKEANGHRILLTPNGDFVLNLTEEEESRFLELQTQVAKTNGLATAFTAPKYTPGTGFSLIKGRAVPNGVPSFFPAGPGSFPPDPVGKMHREEAIGCINQHVLPSLNLGSYKPNSSFPNANGVNLQALAPWISGPDKDGRRLKAAGGRGDGLFGGRVPNGENANEAWDELDDDEVEGPSPAIGSTPLMSVEEAESVLVAAKKQHEAMDKKFKQSMMKLRRQFGLH